MYLWWVFIHLIGVFGFLVAHGVSVAVLFRLRREQDPAKVNALLELSGTSTRVFYASLAILLVGGVVAATLGHWWSKPWIWVSIGILVLASVAMTTMATPFYRKVGLVARSRAAGSEAVSGDQFDQLLRSSRPTAVASIGILSLAGILGLMVFKPTFTFGGGGTEPTPTPTVSAGQAVIPVVARNVAFQPAALSAPAGNAFVISFDNEDAATEHNVAIYSDSSASKALFVGKRVTGPRVIAYHVPALPAGSYFFRCDVHPFMNGPFTVGGASP